MGRRTRGVEVPKIQTQSPFIGQFGHFCGPIGRGKHPPYLARVWQSQGHKFPRDLKNFKYGWVGIIKSTSGASLQPLILGVGATTDFNRMAISTCPFLLEVRMPHSFANSRNIAILCQTKPTVQRMTNYYKNWLAWGF